MKNICYIVSGIDKAVAFEWIASHLDPHKYRLHFVLLHSQRGGLEDFLAQHHVPYTRIAYRHKKDIPKAVWHTMQYLRKHHVSLVHCHLLDAGLVGILAAKLVGVPIRIYSRHYSTYHHVYHPKGVWYDRIINVFSTHLVAVSELVKRILVEKEQVAPSKITVVHHGFVLEAFDQVNPSQIATLQQRHGYGQGHPVIGVIARYTQWKGIQYIIPAFGKLLVDHPTAHLVLANAKGEYTATIQQLLATLPQGSFTEIVFEADLFALYKSFDFFVHTPIDAHSEAFGQVYVETMAAGVPSVVTLSGIALEIVEDGKNALVCDYQSTESVYQSLLVLLQNESLRQQIGQEAKKTVFERFGLQRMIKQLEQLYG